MRQKLPRGPMPAQLYMTEKQEAILRQIIRRSKSAQSLVVRARIVLAATQLGYRNQQIGRDLNISAQTVNMWRGRWLAAEEVLVAVEAENDEKQLRQAIEELLTDAPRSGTPAKFSAEQVCQIIAVACEAPSLSGRPITEWTARELADEAAKRHIVESISASQVARFLKRGGVETASQPLLAEQPPA